MVLFKGVSTAEDYEQCLEKGLCEEHAREISQSELAALKDEFPKKAFNYIRINIIYPLLFEKSPKCEKIKLLMERTPALSKILRGGDISDAANTIFVLDSVIIFTLCQLSQICCIGALFHIKKKSFEDPKLKSLRALLLVDQLDKTIVQYLYPILQKNFAGYDSDIIKASHIITLIFVRNFCTKFTMKTAIENIEKDIKGEECWEHFKVIGDDYYQKQKYEEASKSYISALIQNLYSAELYIRLSNCFMNLKMYKAAQLHAYFAVSVEPTASEGYRQFFTSLILQEQYQEAVQVVHYAVHVCGESEEFYATIKNIHKDAVHLCKKESAIDRLKNSVQPTDLTEKNPPDEKHQLVSVELIDSDSAESENEFEVNKKNAELVDSDDSDGSETVGKKPMINMQESKTKSLGTKKKRLLSEGTTDVSLEDMDITKINSYWKESSEALLADCGYKAVQIFRGPLRDFIESPKLFPFEECDIVCIKYSYGIAYCKSGGFDDLHKCITILKDIIENHDSITFPAAYYSLGLAYRKLNRFKESLNYLEIVQNFLSKGIHFKVYPWPGMTTVIQETKPDILKSLVQDLIKECENPPNPDAFCRYASCEYQPTIYYTDPDFKGYVSLSCSEQCCMQYHFLCWKAMKTERNLTDKEFLEKACFTPDCDGIIVKIQNIDKKGDLSKEFTSDIKKHSKREQKWSKLDKKSESKDKRRKKMNSKPEEISNGSERRNSCNAGDESLPLQLPGYGGVEEAKKLEKNVKVEEIKEASVDSQNTNDSFPENSTEGISYTCCIVEDLNDTKEVKENGSDFFVNDCIKNNVYSYMDDFLQHHGPLKVDDPLLVDEIDSFPDEVHTIIGEYGGIGNFLKDDLRFAYVGDLYVCVVSDLATAYKMCSSSCLPTEFKNLQSLESSEITKYYNKCNGVSVCQNTALNPDAMEYTPSGVAKNNSYKFSLSNSSSRSLNSGSLSFVPAAFELPQCNSDICQTSNSSSTFHKTEMHVGKSKSCETVVNKLNGKKTDSDFCAAGNLEKEKMPDHTYDQKLSLSSTNLDSNATAVIVSENVVTCEDMSVSASKNEKLEFQLLTLLKLYYSEDMKSCRQNIDSYIKPYIVKKIPELATSGTMTDVELLEAESSNTEMNLLSEQNMLLQNKLELATLKQEQLSTELSELKKHLKEVEVQKEEYENKEQERLLFLESLTEAQATVSRQKWDLISLTNEKNSLQKNVDNLTISLKNAEEKLKSALDAKEKEFNKVLLNLQNEKDELKNRAKYAELQVLHLKKSEYLRKIDEKSVEAAKKKKELTDGLSIVSCNLNPVVQNNMKTLSMQLTTYINNLNAVKLDFMRKIDKEIEEVQSGTPLKEIKELKMKELPEIPCWKNLFSSNGLTQDKSAFKQMPFNFGLNMGASHQVPLVQANSLFSSDVPVNAAAKVPATKVVSASNVIAPPAVTGVSSSALKAIGNQKTELSKGSMDFDLNSQVEFKSAMASFNSFASTPYTVPSLDDEFHKKCDVFRHPDPVPMSIPKVPPGIQTPVIHTSSEVSKNPVHEPLPKSLSSSKEKSIDCLDTVPITKAEAGGQSTWDLGRKKTGGSKAYEKLLNKLKELFPQYSQDQLILFVKEFRAQNKGTLSGLHFDTIITEISNLIMVKRVAEKKITEPRVLPKSTKVLVNKKLVPDPKIPVISEQQQSVKKKTAWGTGTLSDPNRKFCSSLDDDCTICCDPMTTTSAYKVSCGHAFHESCIRQWLGTRNNCPVCRVLLLLPEEYPSLS